MSLLGGGPALAQDHLIPQERIRARVGEKAGARQKDLETLRALLSSPEAQKGAARIGIDIKTVQVGLAHLSDEEARDLASRASSFDPAAGLSSDVNELLVILLIVAIVVVVLKAVD